MNNTKGGNTVQWLQEKTKGLRSAEYPLRGLSHVKIDVTQAGSATVAMLLSEYNAVHLLAIAIEE